MRPKLIGKDGRVVPESEYDFHVGDDGEFAFRLKKPSRARTGKYRIVLANDAGESDAEINVNFLGR